MSGDCVEREDFPEIVCLCGSTRFEDAFKSEQFRLTVKEQSIVLTVAGGWKDAHDDVWDEIGGEDKESLDELHFRKIDLADRVHVLNVGGYVGSSTSNEIRHAIETGTEITWLEPENVPEEFDDGLRADGSGRPEDGVEQEVVRKKNRHGVMKDYVRTDIGTSVVETPKRIHNPVTERTEDLTNLSADGYCRRFLAMLSASSSPDVVDFGSEPVATFDKDRWDLREQDGCYWLVKREAETPFGELVLESSDTQDTGV